MTMTLILARVPAQTQEKTGSKSHNQRVWETQKQIGGPGCWALVPSGVPHTFGNAGESPARLLIIHAPAAEAYFVALQELWSRPDPPTPEEDRALMKQHGLEPVELEPPSG